MSATNEVTGTAKEQASAVAATTKDQTANVAGTASEAAKDVAGTAKDQAAAVATEVKTQARDLLGETREQLRSQSEVQTQKAAQTVRSLASELQGLASGKNDAPGPATDVVRQLADRANGIASRLESSSPEQLLDDVRQFARQRTGLFLLAAGTAGFAAARLAKAAAANKEDGASQAQSRPSAISTGYVPAVSAAPMGTSAWETAPIAASATTSAPSYYVEPAVVDPSPSPASSALAGDVPEYGSTGYADPAGGGIRPIDPLLDNERGLR